jgi:hypothetical protein
MKINEINALLQAQEPVGSVKKRTESEPAPTTDRVDISSAARQKQSTEALIKKIKEYIAQLPTVRDDQIAEISQKLREGYTIDRQTAEVIANKIMELLKI